MSRIARQMATGDRLHRLREMLLMQRWLPAGRIQSPAGTPLSCFTAAPISDQMESIMGVAEQVIRTMHMGGNVEIDFNTIRPRGSLITSNNSSASGPVSFMGIYDAVGKCAPTVGSMTGVLRIDHPDIIEFIYATNTSLKTSVLVTDAFMHALQSGEAYDLKWGGQVYSKMDAAEVWETLMCSARDYAQPGVLFSSREPNSTCLQGSFNLTKYLYDGNKRFDWHVFEGDIRQATRALDALVDIAVYPLPAQAECHRKTRRLGLGVTALANCLETMGMPYGSPEFLDFEGQVLDLLTQTAYRESIEMAKESGSFPLLDREEYTANSILPEDIQNGIRRHGIRNSRLTAIAPCRTISLCADNISQSIEPVSEVRSRRIIYTPAGPLRIDLIDYGMLFLGTTPKVKKDVTIQEHLDVLLVASKRVDGSVAKTLNVPADTPWDIFQGIYVKAWEGGAKGCTTYRAECRKFGILEKAEDVSACYVDPKREQ